MLAILLGGGSAVGGRVMVFELDPLWSAATLSCPAPWQGVAWRLIERNPAAGASLPRASSPEMRPLRPAEARRFLAAVEGHPLQALFVLAVTTGMRQGELLALRWRDIDWSARRVAVGHTLVRLDGRWWLGDPKAGQ